MRDKLNIGRFGSGSRAPDRFGPIGQDRIGCVKNRMRRTGTENRVRRTGTQTRARVKDIL